MALSTNYRSETIGRSDCHPIVRLLADTTVRWDYRPKPNCQIVYLVVVDELDHAVCLQRHARVAVTCTFSIGICYHL